MCWKILSIRETHRALVQTHLDAKFGLEENGEIEANGIHGAKKEKREREERRKRKE